MKKWAVFAAAPAAAAILIWLTAFTVGEREFAIVTQFGRPTKIITNPGLYWKLPAFLHKVNRLARQIQVFKTQPIQLLLGDKNPIIFNCYICWKLSDPLLFFQSVNKVDIAQQKLGDMINSQLGSVLGDYSLDQVINTEPEQVKLEEMEERLLTNTNRMAKDKYGIEVVQIGIHRMAYPTIVANAVYNRMRAEREKEAMKYRAEGKEEAAKIEARTDREVSEILAGAYKEAEITKAEGDRKSMKIYAEAYGKDQEFFDFLKSLETYKKILKSRSTLILSTDSPLFKYLVDEGDSAQSGGKP